jgi:phytoene/squalene synthetase
MDALMTAVSLVGLLQEAAQRYRLSGTMTLPAQWLSGENIAPDALSRPRSTAALRKVFSRGIDRAHELLAIAGPARNLRELGGHAAATSLLARRLLQRLARRDPLARPVALGMFDRLALRLANIS